MRKIIRSKEFIQDYMSNMPLKQIAKKYGISAPQVSYYAVKKFGLPKRPRGNRRKIIIE